MGYLFNGRKLFRRAAESAGLPKLLMIGSEDVFCSVNALEAFVASLPDPKQGVVREHVDHFSMYPHIPEVMSSWIFRSFNTTDLRDFAAKGQASSDRTAENTEEHTHKEQPIDKAG